jgi:hypothetical protein
MDEHGHADTDWQPWRVQGRLRLRRRAVWVQTTQRNLTLGQFRGYQLSPYEGACRQDRSEQPFSGTAKLSDYFPLLPAI